MLISPTDIVIVSDLHLRRRRERARARAPGAVLTPVRDEAFARFAGEIARRAAGGRATRGQRGPGITDSRSIRLVLLGDTFDLPGMAVAERFAGIAAEDAWAEAARAELDAIAATSPAFFEGVRTLLAAGVDIDLLPGNHDIALLIEPVRERLVELIGGDHSAGFTFRPWILHVPGVLYAEHGQQYHDINAFPTLLRPAEWVVTRAPLGPRFEALLAALDGATIDEGRLNAAGRIALAEMRFAFDVVLFALPDHRLAGRRSAYRAEVLPEYAASVGLPVDVVIALDRLSQAGAGSIVRRLGGMVVGRARARVARRAKAPPSRAAYLGPAVRRIQEILAGAGVQVPVYAFGHTHAPALESLASIAGGGPSSGSPAYLNAGSWDRVRPADLARRIGPGRFSLAWITGGDGRTTAKASLLAWDDSAGQFVPLPD